MLVDVFYEALKYLFARVLQLLSQFAVRRLHEVLNYGRVRLAKGHRSPWVFGKAGVTLDNVLQQTSRRFLKLRLDNRVEHSAYRVKALRGLAQVLQAVIVQQNLLNDKRRHCLRQFSPALHDSQAKRNDFCLE